MTELPFHRDRPEATVATPLALSQLAEFDDILDALAWWFKESAGGTAAALRLRVAIRNGVRIRSRKTRSASS